jgi:Xaa-Pro aminopeptidase
VISNYNVLKILILLVVGSGFSFAQELESPADVLSPEFHKSRRDELRKKLPNNSVAVFFANAVRNRANDVEYIYHQSPDFYYLTGYKEPHAVLLIFKENQQKKDGNSYNEIIFVQPRNEMAEMWTGKRLGDKGVISSLAINEAFNNTEFIKYELDFSSFDKVIFTDFLNDVRDNGRDEGDLFSLINQFKIKVNYPGVSETLEIEPKPENLDTQSLRGIMAGLRGIKTPEELELLKKAVQISVIGQVEVMKAMKPGMSETEVQGIHEFVFKKFGSEYEGYPSIVGAGNNGCILHYIENHKPSITDGELILMDLGAEYRGYTADITRTIPVNGKFTTEQKAIYDLVYKAQQESIEASKAGATWKSTNQLSKDIINKGLFELGIISSIEERHLYYPHGLGHHIGLDVHDNGNYQVFEPGMVFTVEPGIYIPEGSKCDEKWWEIAVRIEDDVVIGEDGNPVLLSGYAPRTSEEIEKMMKQPSVLDGFVLPELE